MCGRFRLHRLHEGGIPYRSNVRQIETTLSKYLAWWRKECKRTEIPYDREKYAQDFNRIYEGQTTKAQRVRYAMRKAGFISDERDICDEALEFIIAEAQK